MFRTTFELADLVNVVDVQSSLSCGDAPDDAPMAASGARTKGTTEPGREDDLHGCCPPKPWRFVEPLRPLDLFIGLWPFWNADTDDESIAYEALVSGSWGEPCHDDKWLPHVGAH